MNDDDLDLTIGNITISGSGTDYLSYDSSLSTITLTGAGTGASYSSGITYAIAGGGAGGNWYNGTTYAVSGTGSPTWVSSGTTTPSIKVSGEAEFDGDVKIQGISVLSTLQKINERLAILVPDPKRLEKYQALKQAYDHYKTLEALCIEQDDTDPKK